MTSDFDQDQDEMDEKKGEHCKILFEQAFDLLNLLLEVNSDKRIKADNALNNLWFHNC